MFTALASMLSRAVQELTGPLGLSIATLGLIGTIIGCLWFHVPLHYLWKVAILVCCLFAASAITGGLRA